MPESLTTAAAFECNNRLNDMAEVVAALEGPRFSTVAHKVNTASIAMPIICPACHSKLEFQDAWLVCPNTKCSSKVKGSIRKFCANLDIKNVGDGAIDSLVDKGIVKCPADLYEVTESQFCTLDRKGSAHYQKMVAGLNARKTVSVEKFFGSLNIESAGEGIFLNLVNAGFNTYEKIMSLTVPQAATAMRVGEEAAKNITRYLAGNRADIERLHQHLTIVSKAGKKLEGQSFIITGTCSRPKNEIYADIEAAGGTVAKSLTKNTTYLITADPASTSGKAKNAREWGIKMITEAQLLAML